MEKKKSNVILFFKYSTYIFKSLLFIYKLSTLNPKYWKMIMVLLMDISLNKINSISTYESIKIKKKKVFENVPVKVVSNCVIGQLEPNGV